MIILDDRVPAIFEAFRTMEETREVAREFDRLLTIIGNADGTVELVALVTMAQLTSENDPRKLRKRVKS